MSEEKEVRDSPPGEESSDLSEGNEAPAGGSKALRVIGIIRTIFIYLLAIAIVVAAIIFAGSRSPTKSIFGFRYYTVLTPSMEPTYSVGDVVIVKLKNAEDISVGDVITFNPSTDSDAYLTHRVTQKFPDYEGSGVTCFKTKGDANETEDSFLIDSSRVIGTVSFSIPKIGYFIRFIQLKWFLVLPIVVMIFIFFKLLQIYFAAPEKTGEDNEENKTPDTKSDE